MSNHARLTTTLALALGLCAIPAIAQDNALGRDEYMGSCAACHGAGFTNSRTAISVNRGH